MSLSRSSSASKSSAKSGAASSRPRSAKSPKTSDPVDQVYDKVRSLQERILGKIPEQAILNLFSKSCEEIIYWVHEEEVEDSESDKEHNVTQDTPTTDTTIIPNKPTERTRRKKRTVTPSINPDLTANLRKIKDLFLIRDYESIFTNPLFLDPYVAAYSPSRALCYWDMFVRCKYLRQLLRGKEGGKPSEVFCMGAGSCGELVGIATAMVGLNQTLGIAKKQAVLDGSNEKMEENNRREISQSNNDERKENTAQGGDEKDSTTSGETQLKIHIQDLGLYHTAFSRISHQLTQPPFSLSRDRLSITNSFGEDVLDFQSPSLDENTKKIASADLITALFIMNELLAESKAQFVKLIGLLVKHMKKGAMLLIVDSAGSFSEVYLCKDGKEKPAAASAHESGDGRTYMVYHLLDKIGAFEILEQTDSRWYRYPEDAGLDYPLKLTNIRYFMRLYKHK
ncbi:hypothetical protein HDV05_000081 [Chytridiales sp. JEL 0842]|nr:hypothetical protein HDV05_000081 [Chytridiales sp. JEL 0842]